MYLEILFRKSAGVWEWVGEKQNETGRDLVLVDPSVACVQGFSLVLNI